MNDPHEVISAFLDDEPFDPQTLANALSDASGRALLIDMVALRCLVQPDEAIPVHVPLVRRRAPLRAVMAVAAVVVALVGGYFMGQSRTESTATAAPAPTRVVEGPPAWVPVNPSGRSAQ
jgi:hypothetical protein